MAVDIVSNFVLDVGVIKDEFDTFFEQLPEIILPDRAEAYLGLQCFKLEWIRVALLMESIGDFTGILAFTVDLFKEELSLESIIHTAQAMPVESLEDLQLCFLLSFQGYCLTEMVGPGGIALLDDDLPDVAIAEYFILHHWDKLNEQLFFVRQVHSRVDPLHQEFHLQFELILFLPDRFNAHYQSVISHSHVYCSSLRIHEASDCFQQNPFAMNLFNRQSVVLIFHRQTFIVLKDLALLEIRATPKALFSYWHRIYLKSNHFIFQVQVFWEHRQASLTVQFQVLQSQQALKMELFLLRFPRESTEFCATCFPVLPPCVLYL